MKISFWISLVAVFLFLPGCGGCGGKEPGVELYTDMDAAIVTPLVAQWKNELGVPINVTYADNPALVEKGVGLSQRIMEEKDSYKTDVYWGRDPATMQKLADDGVTDPTNSAEMLTFPENCRNTEGHWFGFGARVRVVVYNKQALGSKKPPESLVAMTRPEWKGKTALADPRASGSSQYHLAVLYTAFSDSDANTLLSKFKDNAVQILPTEAAVIEAVASGKAAWGITDSDLAEKAAADGKIGYLATDQADHSTSRALNKPDGDVFTLGTPALPYPVALINARHSEFEGEKLFHIIQRLTSSVTLSKVAPNVLPTHTSLLENPPSSRKGHPLNLSKLRFSPAKPAEIVKKQPTLLVIWSGLFGDPK